MAKKNTKSLAKKPSKKKVKITQKAKNLSAEKTVVSDEGMLLNEILDISYAEKFRSELVNILEKGDKSNIILVASKVIRLTTPCIQVLLSFAKSCEMLGKKLKISAASEQFAKAFADLGLSKNLNSWS